VVDPTKADSPAVHEVALDPVTPVLANRCGDAAPVVAIELISASASPEIPWTAIGVLEGRIEGL